MFQILVTNVFGFQFMLAHFTIFKYCRSLKINLKLKVNDALTHFVLFVLRYLRCHIMPLFCVFLCNELIILEAVSYLQFICSCHAFFVQLFSVLIGYILIAQNKGNQFIFCHMDLLVLSSMRFSFFVCYIRSRVVSILLVHYASQMLAILP